MKKSKMIEKITVWIMVIGMVLGIVSVAVAQSDVFLPVVYSGNGNVPVTQEVPVGSGYVASVPLDNGTLAVISIQGYTFNVHIYDQYNAATFLDGWSTSDAQKFDIVGCIWVVTESVEGLISTHKVILPDGVSCEK